MVTTDPSHPRDFGTAYHTLSMPRIGPCQYQGHIQYQGFMLPVERSLQSVWPILSISFSHCVSISLFHCNLCTLCLIYTHSITLSVSVIYSLSISLFRSLQYTVCTLSSSHSLVISLFGSVSLTPMCFKPCSTHRAERHLIRNIAVGPLEGLGLTALEILDALSLALWQ